MYTYYDLLGDVNYLSHYLVPTGQIGASTLGRLIPYIHIGEKKGNQIIVTGGIHAREHITTLLVMHQVYHMLNRFPDNIRGGIYFVPCLNPDGALLATLGINSVREEYRKSLIAINGGSRDFSLYKANVCGVDLNTNFDARWGTGVMNTTHRGSENFIGSAPFSEKETSAIRDFTKKIRPKATVSYHAKGREIYWEFFQSAANKKRDRRISEELNELLGYKLVDGDLGSAGGYKDWCIETLNIPSYTIEIGDDSLSHPITDAQNVKEDIMRNEDLPYKLLSLINAL